MFAKCKISYLGTCYHGFQFQKNKASVASELQNALTKIFKQPVKIVSAGRTDAGVHAYAQVISFELPFHVSEIALTKAMNSLLPDDIRINSIVYMDNFHALRDACSRTYHYYFSDSDLPLYLVPYVAYHPLKSFETLNTCLEHFIGSHDFIPFSKHNPSLKPGPRTITQCDLSEVVCPDFMSDSNSSKLFCITVSADAFLHHLIRHIVGAAWACDAEQLTQRDICHMLEKNIKTMSWRIAPAKGLWFMNAEYNLEKCK